MHAIGYHTPGNISARGTLTDIDLPKPVAHGRDILVAVKAVSVNPVDTKVRRKVPPSGSEWKVLGWDAAGVVVATGEDAVNFKPGDEVYYAGSILRPGTNADFHLVDERIVALKPTSLGFAEAAALPLTSITAWETLFDRLGVRQFKPGTLTSPAVASTPKSLLIIGAAGGVGSITIQLARKLTNLVIIATASRPETQEWVRELGAHHVVDHTRSLVDQIQQLDAAAPAFVLSTNTDDYADQIGQLIAAQGHFAFIDEPQALNALAFKSKSVAIHTESMFTRSMFETPDMAQQGQLLHNVAQLVDAGSIKTTLTHTYDKMNAENLKSAHALIESGRARGKLVLVNDAG